MVSHIQLNWLRTFATVGETLSFTLAAKELNMSQSAVSQQMKLLEHYLGKSLFVRANRAIRLTDAGQAFLPLVLDAIQQLNLGAAQIFSPADEAVVDINVNAAFSTLWLAPRVTQFNAIYPQITLRQHSTNWAADFDIATSELEIRYGTGIWAGFESWPLVSSRLRPYCTPGNARLIREPADVLVLPLLEVIGTPQGWDGWLEAHIPAPELSAADSQPRQYMDSYATAAMMAASGAGVCLMYDELLQEGALAEQLVAPFIDGIATDGGYFLCHRAEANLSTASRIFKDWLLNQ